MIVRHTTTLCRGCHGIASTDNVLASAKRAAVLAAVRPGGGVFERRVGRTVAGGFAGHASVRPVAVGPGRSVSSLDPWPTKGRHWQFVGPLPLRTAIRYDDIRQVEIGRTTLLDGLGIHLSLRRVGVEPVGRDCVVLHLRNGGILRIGSDDTENLAGFIQTRMNLKARAKVIRLLQFTTRDLCWLVLLVAMGCAALANGQDALRQVVAVLAVIAVICWFVAAV